MNSQKEQNKTALNIFNTEPIISDCKFILQRQLFESKPETEIYLEYLEIQDDVIIGKGLLKTRNMEYLINGIIQDEMYNGIVSIISTKDNIIYQKMFIYGKKYNVDPKDQENFYLKGFFRQYQDTDDPKNLKLKQGKVQKRHHHIELRDPAPTNILLTVEDIPCLLCGKLTSNQHFVCGSKTKANCDLKLCRGCLDNILQIKKDELSRDILNSEQKSLTTQNVGYIKAIFREFFRNQGKKTTSILRDFSEYRWYELYHFNEQKLEFEIKEKLELYISKVDNEEGSMHLMHNAKQHRRYEYSIENQQFQEAQIDESQVWALKSLKQKGQSIQDICVFQDLIQLIIAKNLSLKFSEAIKDQGYSLQYIDTYLLIPLFNNSGQQYYQVEMFQEGDIEKYNTQLQDSYQRKILQKTDGETNIFETLNEDQQLYQKLASAFSHWTYFITKEMFIVVDVQGWRDGKILNLTDPLIHSYLQGMFGIYDLGEYGKQTWLKNHDCENNKFCNYLGLQKTKTTDNFEVGFELTEIMRQFQQNQKIFQIQFQTMVTEIYNDDNYIDIEEIYISK
ncbi:myosin heavy chain kinase a-like protein [Stylonychia lemnae]|uniref:Myosin heavy chain kinase a-like protein n=1 Tax=Stylonychia lemnae TaxID=5949 RepID=A0A077ZZ66_STYLE|nr:myosin heavy chain kinase a-like protein [Stylonychia lemnae]|eukprot:CDW74872.1 myosin heavy chain kinase a-like protein [Stylonychia lemnae]